MSPGRRRPGGGGDPRPQRVPGHRGGPQRRAHDSRSGANDRAEPSRRPHLAHLAALRASLCLYLSARHVEEVQEELLRHYPADTPVAIGYRVSWPDQWLQVVPLQEMARVSRERQLIRTTLYVVSPALQPPGEARSRLYSASHQHLFRGGAEA